MNSYSSERKQRMYTYEKQRQKHMRDFSCKGKGTMKRLVYRAHGYFTMIELLVVIGIIAILMAILLSTLSQVRSKAMMISCSGQMKQLGTSAMLYSNDYNSYVVPSYGTSNTKQWAPLVMGYMNVSSSIIDVVGEGPIPSGQTARKQYVRGKILYCPELWKWKIPPANISYTHTSYAVNLFATYVGGLSSYTSTYELKFRRLGDRFLSPLSIIPLFVEYDYSHSYSRPAGNQINYGLHGNAVAGTTNYAFMDGSVRMQTKQDVTQKRINLSKND